MACSDLQFTLAARFERAQPWLRHVARLRVRETGRGKATRSGLGLALHSAGFTLIETMIVVVIVAILAAVAAPSVTEMFRTTRLSGASSALQVSLNLARSEAIKGGSDARVTVAANGTAGAWTNGWTVFADRTNNANAGVAPAADGATMTRLEVAAAPTGPISFSQSGTLNYFTYNGQGRLIDASGAAMVGQSVWFSDGSSERFCLVITNTGRVRVTRVAASASCPTN